ncbi:MAG: hypothetical protein EA362_03340 [Saprospirales bacterium]|nr:MAG: hypothetical protein EA362_03340 [Saprospirales bacterium]
MLLKDSVSFFQRPNLQSTRIIVFSIVICSFFTIEVNAQNNSFDIRLDWNNFPVPELINGEEPLSIPYFDGAGFSSSEIPLPIYVERFSIPGPGTININATVRRSVSPSFSVSSDVRDQLQSSIRYSYIIEQERGQFFARVFFVPMWMQGNNLQLAEQIMLSVSFSPQGPTSPAAGRSGFKDHSELADGQIVKIAVGKSGIFRIDAEVLNEAGINPSNIRVDQLKVLGNRGGMLPQLAGAPRVDDVEEVPVKRMGGANTFGEGGYLLFFAEGPSIWHYNITVDRYEKPKNIYDDYNYYFLKIDDQENLTIEQTTPTGSPQQILNQYDYLERFEIDRVNLMGAAPGFYGSGQRWFGDNFANVRTRDYSTHFNLEDFVPGTELKLWSEFAVRSNTSSTVRISIGNQSFTRSVGQVNTTSLQGNYATLAGISGEKVVGQNPLSITFEVSNSGSVFNAWLDFIQIQGRKDLQYSGTPLLFHHYDSISQVTAYDLINSTNHDLEVWDISNPHEVVSLIPQTSPQGLRFSFSREGLSKFAIFRADGSHLRPRVIGQIENQNLHAFQTAELVIVYHPDFEQAALELADHRRVFSGLDVVAVSVDKVFNEFGGGSADVTAIRDFARMFYHRTDNFRYLLLIGDASYDYRGLMPDLPDQNFIPVYQTPNSLNAISSFPSDDYFALLDDNEGANLVGAIDISVGRLPVRTATEAANVVNKLIHYDLNSDGAGDWMLKMGVVADDGDNNTHLRQTRSLVSMIRENHPEINFEKVYSDAYERVSTPGGSRFPEARREINSMINRGVLALNYFGHGGPSGWAQERILQIEDIQSWTNRDRLPLMVTATCSFANFDDPAVTSAGEHVILSPNGGAFSLLTTTRLVFATANERVTRAVFERLFEIDSDGHQLAVGDVMMHAKNSNGIDTLNVNARKFALLGDPSQKIALSRFNVNTTAINETPIEVFTDTLKALQKVVVEGEIADFDGHLVGDFNGVVDITLLDKPVTLSTLAQASGSNKQEFKVQKNILFKGSASVINGRFSFEFIMPKDINYEVGFGRLSYIAFSDQGERAAGANDDVLIGGSVDSLPDDGDGPMISLFMNDEQFVFGGITDPNPTLLVILEDESGINVTGNSIGHELSAYLNGDFNNRIILNEFYQAEKDNFRRGTVRYPFSNLEPGQYEINVTAWDILNNKSEARLEFVVMDNKNGQISKMLNYPNPFMNHTEFQFEHNMPSGTMDVRVGIYSLSGRLVKDIHTTVFSDGYRVTGIEWDGRDDFGDRLANGVYLYKVSVRPDHTDLNNKTVESKFERLLILR